ncbi:hypothetical protein KCU61_g72, partial [Aureobasidium melanogenum]
MFLYPVSFQWLARGTAMIAMATAYHYAGQAVIRGDDRPIWYCRADYNREGEGGWSSISPVSSSGGVGQRIGCDRVLSCRDGGCDFIPSRRLIWS